MDLEKNGYIQPNSGYRYSDENGNDLVDLHVDTCNILEERANNETKYWGNVSVRKAQEEKPIIMQCIFKQYTMTNKSWKASNGAVVLTPKDDGQGDMIHAFQSWEFGFDLQLNQQ